MDNEKKLEDFKNVQYRMNAEGFHYCFESYSDFEEIEDKEFHKLRKYYLQYANLLKDYVEKTIERLENI